MLHVGQDENISNDVTRKNSLDQSVWRQFLMEVPDKYTRGMLDWLRNWLRAGSDGGYWVRYIDAEWNVNHDMLLYIGVLYCCDRSENNNIWGKLGKLSRLVSSKLLREGGRQEPLETEGRSEANIVKAK